MHAQTHIHIHAYKHTGSQSDCRFMNTGLDGGNMYVLEISQTHSHVQRTCSSQAVNPSQEVMHCNKGRG
jgi:hypothetical protein